jgi:hypothetical protein
MPPDMTKPADYSRSRLLREIDDSMLRTGLRGFHGAPIGLPHRPEDCPDAARLEARFERFTRTTASSAGFTAARGTGVPRPDATATLPLLTVSAG